jgi:acyl-coenzyme A synthetase/AMP-(fatty) acid ligase
MVLSSGENIIPEELEAELYRIPGVKECLIYEKNGAAAARFYTGAADTEENERLKEALRSLNRSLPVYKRIQQFELSSQPLPKTDSGKLLRNGA